MTNRGTFLAEPILSDRPWRTWFQGVNEAINRELFEIKIKVNDVELNYEEHGSGAETVVFGHGFGSSARKWQNLFELLPANYHCYAADLRGFGKSAEITENINTAQMAVAQSGGH